MLATKLSQRKVCTNHSSFKVRSREPVVTRVNLVPRVSPIHASWGVKRRDPGNEVGLACDVQFVTLSFHVVLLISLDSQNFRYQQLF